MIELQDDQTAPLESREALKLINSGNGFIPNLFGALANSPSALNGFFQMMNTNDGGTLSPTERQIVQLIASIENNGAYCVAGHSAFASNIGMSKDLVDDLREGRAIANKRYQGLADFTRALMKKRGHVDDEDIAAFEASGFQVEQAMEVVVGSALKTVTNFVTSMYRLPLDEQFQSFEWEAGNI